MLLHASILGRLPSDAYNPSIALLLNSSSPGLVAISVCADRPSTCWLQSFKHCQTFMMSLQDSGAAGHGQAGCKCA